MRKPGAAIGGTRHGVYGPTQRETRDRHRTRAPRVEADLSAGTCAQLLPAVADRYFAAAGQGHRWETATARTMCVACPVLVACLADAITRPLPDEARTGVIRGGVTAWHLAALAAEAERSGASAHIIALREAGHMVAPIRGAHGSKHLRAGEFVSPALLG